MDSLGVDVNSLDVEVDEGMECVAATATDVVVAVNGGCCLFNDAQTVNGCRCLATDVDAKGF